MLDERLPDGERRSAERVRGCGHLVFPQCRADHAAQRRLTHWD